jgi:hypothetical protein
MQEVVTESTAEDAEPQTPTHFGTKYVVRGILVGPTGRTAVIISLWFVPRGEPAPRFITAYPE